MHCRHKSSRTGADLWRLSSHIMVSEAQSHFLALTTVGTIPRIAVLKCDWSSLGNLAIAPACLPLMAQKSEFVNHRLKERRKALHELLTRHRNPRWLPLIAQV